MLKFILFIFVIILSQCLNAQKIIQIGSNTIEEKDIKPSQRKISIILKKNKKDAKEIIHISTKLKLALLLNRFLYEQLENKFFSKLVSKQDIDKLQVQTKAIARDRAQRYQALLKAINYINNSKDKEKYKIAYEKYLKTPLICSYDSFKSNCENKNYVDFVKKQVQRNQSGKIPKILISAMFKKKLEDYILKTSSQNNPQIAEHIKLSTLHSCNFKNKLIRSWLIEEAGNIGYKIYTDKYGNNLADILWPPFEQYQKQLKEILNKK